VSISDQLTPETFTFGNINRGSHEANIRMQRVLEKSKGYSTYDSVAGDMRYPGTPWLINARYEFALKDRILAGITVEKDPGENLFKHLTAMVSISIQLLLW
jgi:hypothetical protein